MVSYANMDKSAFIASTKAIGNILEERKKINKYLKILNNVLHHLHIPQQ